MHFPRPEFDRAEALNLWSRLVAGWSNSLNNEGTKTLMDGIHFEYDDGGSQEGVTRMMWGLGGWLSQPDSDPVVEWQGVRYDVEALTRRALLHGTNPESPGYWGASPFPGSPDIWMVDAGQIAFAVWQSRHRIWDHLSPSEQEQIVAWLEVCGHHPGSFRNNFALFWGLNHICRKALGQRYDLQLIDDVMEYLEGIYCGNGWYDDGPTRGTNHFDDYNFWVFASHSLAMSAVDGHNRSDWQSTVRNRARQLLITFPNMFSARGAYTEHGRSLSYKFGRLGAPLWALQQECWPHSPGMLRRLVGRHLRWYADNGALRGDGSLRQELTSQGSPEIREGYISTGSAYWATEAFGGLWSLPDGHAFWTEPEAELPVEQQDFTIAVPEPGWVLVGDKASGEVQRFSASGGRYAAKYGKFHYTTLAPFNVGQIDGQPSPDGMLSLISGDDVGHRSMSEAWHIDESGWMRFRYVEMLGDLECRLETIIVPQGSRHIRIHRILDVPSNREITAVEGAAALGYAAGEDIQSGKSTDPLRSWAKVQGRSGSRFIEIEAISGYSAAVRPAAWRGRYDVNSVYGRNVIPMLRVDNVVSGMVLASRVTIGTEDDRASEPDEVEVRWQPDDTVEIIQGDSTVLLVPSLN